MKGMKTGGRKKGTPNKDNPLKGYLKAHSAEYFMPKQLKQKGKIVNISDFERDMAELTPDDRVNAEIRILEYHTPRMKAIDVDVNADVKVHTIEDKLRALCGEGVEDNDDDE